MKFMTDARVAELELRVRDARAPDEKDLRVLLDLLKGLAEKSDGYHVPVPLPDFRRLLHFATDGAPSELAAALTEIRRIRNACRHHQVFMYAVKAEPASVGYAASPRPLSMKPTTIRVCALCGAEVP